MVAMRCPLGSSRLPAGLRRGEAEGESSLPMERLAPASSEQIDKAGQSVLMMRERNHFSMEGEGEVVLDVLRLGAPTSRLSVGYETVHLDPPDNKELASQIMDQAGTIVFEVGQVLARVSVPLVDNPHWNCLRRFAIRLTHVSPPGRAMLGSVTQCVVHIIDDDHYPSARTAKSANENRSFRLILGFLAERWRYRYPTPIKCISCLFYISLHGVFATYVPVIIIDYGLLDTDWHYGLVLLAALYVASSACVWRCEYVFLDLAGGAGSRKDLRNCEHTPLVISLLAGIADTVCLPLPQGCSTDSAGLLRRSTTRWTRSPPSGPSLRTSTKSSNQFGSSISSSSGLLSTALCR